MTLDMASVTEDSTDQDDSVPIAYLGADCSPDVWILDSGCSIHMSPNKGLFTSYHAFNGGTILMLNNVVCKTVGIGTIKLHDGVVRTITDVHHVPELKKNLISLGALATNGYKIVLEGEDLKVFKGFSSCHES